MFEKICELPQYQHFFIVLLVQLIYGGVNLYIAKSPRIKSSNLEEMAYNKIASITKPKGE